MGQIFPGGRVCGGKMGRECFCGTTECTLCFKEVICDFVVIPGHWTKSEPRLVDKDYIAIRV